eukprot:SAG25_NODE_256_length_10933_cov_24.263522_9_plen_100_part_00
MKRLGTPMTAAALLLAVLELDSASGSAELVAVLASGTPPLAGSCCGDPPPGHINGRRGGHGIGGFGRLLPHAVLIHGRGSRTPYHHPANECSAVVHMEC